MYSCLKFGRQEAINRPEKNDKWSCFLIVDMNVCVQPCKEVTGSREKPPPPSHTFDGTNKLGETKKRFARVQRKFHLVGMRSAGEE